MWEKAIYIIKNIGVRSAYSEDTIKEMQAFNITIFWAWVITFPFLMVAFYRCENIKYPIFMTINILAWGMVWVFNYKGWLRMARLYLFFNLLILLFWAVSIAGENSNLHYCLFPVLLEVIYRFQVRGGDKFTLWALAVISLLFGVIFYFSFWSFIPIEIAIMSEEKVAIVRPLLYFWILFFSFNSVREYVNRFNKKQSEVESQKQAIEEQAKNIEKQKQEIEEQARSIHALNEALTHDYKNDWSMLQGFLTELKEQASQDTQGVLEQVESIADDILANFAILYKSDTEVINRINVKELTDRIASRYLQKRFDNFEVDTQEVLPLIFSDKYMKAIAFCLVEGLRNIEKHVLKQSNKVQAKVSFIQIDDETYQLSIQDDGQGFVHPQGKNSQGMTVFSLCAQILRGTFKTQSLPSPQKGTVIIITFKPNE